MRLPAPHGRLCAMKHGVLESRIPFPDCCVSLVYGGAGEGCDDDGGDAGNHDDDGDDDDDGDAAAADDDDDDDEGDQSGGDDTEG